jgi:Yersinia/Haemophilus virulence surface antigen
VPGDESAAYAVVGQVRRIPMSCPGAQIETLFSQAVGEVQHAIAGQGEGEGICRALAIQWVIDRKAGRSMWTKLLKPGGPDQHVLRQIVNQHKSGNLEVARGGGPFKAENQWIRTALESGGLTAAGFDYVPGYEGNFGRKISALAVGFAFCGLGFTGGAGHAVVAHNTGSKLYFFDPNFGEFSFTSAGALQCFLDRLFPNDKYVDKHAISNLSINHFT